MIVRFLLLASIVAGCSGNNSTDTDRASADLKKAQAEVQRKSDELEKNRTDLEAKQRALLDDQQEVAKRQEATVQDQANLGSAQGTLAQARLTYSAAVTERLAKLDMALAVLATKTDAKTVDALAGLRARRDQLSLKLAATPQPANYASDIDITFDAIEADLEKAR